LTPGNQGWLARLLAGIARWLRPGGAPAERALPSRARFDALPSPWHIYRLYALPPHLLLRNAQGRVVALGAVQTDDLTYRYTLGEGSDKASAEFASLTVLLEQVAASITARGAQAAFARFPDFVPPAGLDLDRGAHLDLSMLGEAVPVRE
jgi:hypothetical protein